MKDMGTFRGRHSPSLSGSRPFRQASKNGFIYLAASILALLVVYRWHHGVSSFERKTVSGLRTPLAEGETTRQRANSTLGFGAIYVVSGFNSPRQIHLKEAAAVTEIDLTIPEQTQWTDDDVRRFKAADPEQSRIGTGSVKAWLGHHFVLQKFLDSGLETALILEDDVDWDVRLRSQQVPIAQNAARQLLHGASRDAAQYPWSSPSNWDLLYIGHCGDYFGALGDGVGVGYHHPEHLTKIPYALATDRTIPWRTDLHPFTASLLTAFQVPEQTRLLHRSQWPLCTFGYAVTRDTAHRLINEIAPAKEVPDQSPTAYDAAILGACRDGPLRCYTIQPELFHHMPGDSMIAVTEQGERKIYPPPVDAAGSAQAKYRGETSNIGCGFWSGDFYYDGNKRRMEFLREEVGRKGVCLKGT